jgi:hypothetical protein
MTGPYKEVEQYANSSLQRTEYQPATVPLRTATSMTCALKRTRLQALRLCLMQSRLHGLRCSLVPHFICIDTTMPPFNALICHQMRTSPVSGSTYSQRSPTGASLGVAEQTIRGSTRSSCQSQLPRSFRLCIETRLAIGRWAPSPMWVNALAAKGRGFGLHLLDPHAPAAARIQRRGHMRLARLTLDPALPGVSSVSSTARADIMQLVTGSPWRSFHEPLYVDRRCRDGRLICLRIGAAVRV